MAGRRSHEENNEFMPGVQRRTRVKRSSNHLTVGMAGLYTISGETVRKCLLESLHPDESSIVILDCRPFLAHNDGHIIGAVNVHCPAILRRRSGGRLPLRTVVPIGEVREKLLAGAFRVVVLYEEHGPTFARVPWSYEDSMTFFVARCLQMETGAQNLYILEGGFHDFRQRYPQLCNRSTPSVPTGFLMASTSNQSPALGMRLVSTATLAKSLSSSSSNKKMPLTSSVSACPTHEQEQPVEILPYLYLGSIYHASSKETLQQLGISALLNVSHTCPNLFEDSFQYKCIPVEDSGNADISIWFKEAIEFIDGVKSENGKVLLHCHAGISRSATICMAYLMVTKRLRMEEAYEYVKSRRKIVSPNFHFMGQLLSFEGQVFSPLRTSHSSKPSPRSPLLGVVAAVLHPDSLTPSRSAAQQNVFDFAFAQNDGNLTPAAAISRQLLNQILTPT